jgi:hypothetical protein
MAKMQQKKQIVTEIIDIDEHPARLLTRKFRTE